MPQSMNIDTVLSYVFDEWILEVPVRMCSHISLLGIEGETNLNSLVNSMM